MPPQPFPGGYDPNSGQPPDDSTGNVWGDDVDLPGQFGRGGFKGNPKLILGGGGGPTGQSLTAQPMPAGGVPPDAQGPQIFGPQNSTIPPGKQVGPFRNPFTDAGTLDPSQLKGAGSGFNFPALLRSNPILAGLYATMYSTPAQAPGVGTNMWNMRPSGQPDSGPFNGVTNRPQDRPSYAGPMPQVTNRPQDRPSYAGPPGSPGGPPVTNRPQDRPSYAGPAVAPSAVAAQKPNLGYYMMDRPNMPAGGNARGGGGPSQMGVFGFDPQGPLFGMGANASPPGSLAAAVNPATAAPMPPPRPWPTQAPVPMPVPRPKLNPGGAY